MAANMPMTAMTTRSSIMVKARADFRLWILDFRKLEEVKVVKTVAVEKGLFIK
jgi:hypothetical protein